MAVPKSCFMILVLLASLNVYCISATLLCEDLPINLCAFAVSSSGYRCVLEKQISTRGDIEYECQTSQVSAVEFVEWVETDDCVNSCGINRMTVGISSDALVERGFVKSLCSVDCQGGCPNVVDLFDKLAEGEGVSLSHVCEAQAGTARREMGEVARSNFASLSADNFHAWEATSAALSPTGSLISQGLTSAEAPSPL